MKNINVKLIKTFNPCKSRLDYFLSYYPRFSGDIVDFLSLEEITPSDKIWIAMRVLPRKLLEVFAIDCALSASASNAANTSYGAYSAYAAYAAYAAMAASDAAVAASNAADVARAAAVAASNAADVASVDGYIAGASNANDVARAYAAALAANVERERQVDALIYLCGG